MNAGGGGGTSVDPRRTAIELVDAFPDPIALLEQDGTVVHANPALGSLLEAKPGALEGCAFDELLIEGDVDDLLQRWASTSAAVPGGATLRTGSGGEVRVRADGCRQRVLGLLLVRFRARGGDHDGFSRLRGEVEAENLRQLRDQLQRSLREQAEANSRLALMNEDLDRYAAIVSHDLRAPLGLIRSSLDLARDPRTADDRDELLDVADRAAVQMRQVIEALLALARLGDAEPPDAPVDPTECIEDVLRMYADELRENAAEVTVGDLPPILVQPTHFRQAVQNLVGNAMRFRSPDRAPRISFSGHTDADGRAVIVVADNGSGIAPEDRERVFEPMVRGANAAGREGTGLGLAVVRRVCRAYGGDVAIAESHGPGASFILTLPSGAPGR